MAVLELLVVVESLQATLLLPGSRWPLGEEAEHLVVQAACPVLPVLQVPHLLRGGLFGRSGGGGGAGSAGAGGAGGAVDVALVVVAVVLHAVHTPTGAGGVGGELGISGGVLIVDRYVVVDADGYAVNVVLWDRGNSVRC